MIPISRAAYLVFAAVLACTPGVAAGQQILIRTDATAASGAVSQSDLVVADLETRTFSAPLFQMAGHDDSMVQGVLTDVACIWGLNPKESGLPDNEVVELPLQKTSRTDSVRFEVPLPVRAIRLPAKNAGKRELAIAIGSDSESKLLVFSSDEEGLYLTTAPEVFPLTGQVQDLVWWSGSDSWVALCETSDAVALEVVGHGAHERIPLSFPGPNTIPVRLGDLGQAILVAAAGYDLNRTEGPPVTWLLRVSPSTSVASQPVSIAGKLVGSRDAIFPRGDGSVWVTTESAQTSSSTASLVDIGDPSPVRAVINLPFAASGFHAILAESDGSLLFACGPDLQRFAQNGMSLGSRRFEAPINALVWTNGTLVAGEGNRVHRISLDGLVPDHSINLRSGLAAEIAVPPSLLPAMGDADGDKVLDSIDVDLGDAIPRIVAPRNVVLSRAAAGNQIRIVPLDLSVSMPGYRYALRAPERTGLLLGSDEGELPAVLAARLDPAYWMRSPPGSTSIPVSFSLYQGSDAAPLSSVSVDVLVEAAPVVRTRMLIIPMSRDDDFAAFYRLLKGPPQFYSIDVETRPQPGSLESYQMVAVSLEAVLNGRIPRLELERYTAAGGGLLLIAAPAVVSRLDDAQDWLTPFRIDVRSAAATLRTVRQDCDWCAVWSDAGLGEGLLATVEPPGRALFMPGRAAREGPMTRAPLGLGRMVFVGSDGLLKAVETSPAIRSALLEAIRWLARTGTDVVDQDGDGLADDVEDRNSNGIVDTGETDPRCADTDGDLVVDGYEDSNGNGRVDETETDPCNPDTDGDGTPDGADVDPIPAPGEQAVYSGRVLH